MKKNPTHKLKATPEYCNNFAYTFVDRLLRFFDRKKP